ncbi:hypothetical protein [Vogesella indigofera]|uniref:Uncharacterized protein n=1 Tax=Vogesella indigofera TaxID=45465 RepID=A0ABT5I9G3_VOGIN|nr:hypothetical protein [Vogesella indigofera]MDC7692530.1 hypothetical protein [Vogesella indigofera]
MRSLIWQQEKMCPPEGRHQFASIQATRTHQQVQANDAIHHCGAMGGNRRKNGGFSWVTYRILLGKHLLFKKEIIQLNKVIRSQTLLECLKLFTAARIWHGFRYRLDASVHLCHLWRPCSRYFSLILCFCHHNHPY